MNSSIALGIDIGGTHITASLVDTTTRTIVAGSVQRQHVNSDGTVEEVIATWANTINSSANNLVKAHKVGIAMPGPFDYANGISLMKDNAKYRELYGLNVKTLLANKLTIDSQQIVFINDAAAFLKGELFAGAAIGYQQAIGLTLGTGLGTTYTDGLTVVDANLWCTPFNDSIAEDYLSTRWFVKRFFELSGKQVKGAKEIAQTFKTDKHAQLVFAEFANNLAKFLHYFIQKTNPEIVVIGGNIMNGERFFLPQVIQLLQDKGINIPIKRAKLGENAAILGAAAATEN